MNNLAPIVTLAVAIVAGLFALGRMTVNFMNDKVQTAISPIAEEIVTMKKYHGEHYAATRDLEVNVASLAASVHDHHAIDDHRFKEAERRDGEIMAICGEIKAEIVRSRERLDAFIGRGKA